MDTGLNNKVVLITGADNPQGIGAATARAFAREGARVFVTSFGASADALVDEISRQGGQIAATAVDLSRPETIEPLFHRVEAALGPVDVLVNNAAHSAEDTFDPTLAGTTDWAGRPQETVSASSHDAHFAVNSRAVALMMAEYARRHLAREGSWGRIINISTGGAPGFPGEVSYGASKAALESYSRAAARELMRYGITVNIVSPGPIQTGWIPPELEDEMGQGTPAGRVGRPEDVADVILLLASEQAHWITGQTIDAGGGHRL
jgi:3-oxoacyl-[acyl-carrier protein] reductase